MRIASNGNIGIGTNNPTSKLQINHDNSTTYAMRIFNANNSSGNNSVIFNSIGGASAGKVVYSLDVSGNYGYSMYMNANSSALRFNNGGLGDGTDVMVLASNGNIGIGTNNPGFRLHVVGTTCLNGTISYGIDTWHSDVLGNKKIWYGGEGRTYMLGGQNVAGATCFTFRRGDETIIAEMYHSGAMYILGTLSQGSDSRIKMNIKDIDDNEALNLILAIEPKTYEYIDKETRGIETVYGFIAQQVKEVIPRAIQIVSDFLPNIYKICDCEGDIIYCSIPDNVLINTELKLIYNKNETICKILEIGNDYIKIDKVFEVEKVFVYGYNVDNFHRMSKEYIYTLNVCATQILSRKIEAQNVVIKSYDDRIKDLEMKMERMLNSNATQ
uniref:Peptidase S74 domain-containing protein n=1 Tax=viral metagenome TaxID=1070528 RepID=A0A6C0LNA8_9ZZZZ